MPWRLVMQIVVVGYLHKKMDKRVFRTVKAFSRHFKVLYIYWTEDASEKSYTEGNIEYLPVYHKLCTNPFKEFVNRYKYEREVLRIVDKLSFDLAYIHHFATVKPLAIFRLLSRKNVKIITDFHEYVPEEYLFGVEQIPRSIKMWLGQKLYRHMIMKSDGTVFVSKKFLEDAKEWKPDLKAFNFPNYGNLKIPPINQIKRQKEVIFAGTTERKIENELKIFEILNSKGFSIVSIGTDIKAPFEIKKLPFLKYEKMIERISNAAFSIVSYSCRNKKGNYLNKYVYSMPNKFFDSIAAGTPVILDKDFLGMRELIENDGIGVVIDRDNPKESAEKITAFWESKVEYEKLLLNISRKQDHYVWNEKKEREFIDFIMRVIDS